MLNVFGRCVKKAIFLLYLSSFLSVSAFSQKIDSNRPAKDVILVSDSVRNHKSLSLQLHAGTQGIGADFRYGLMPKLSLRFGGSIIPSVTANNAFTIAGFDADNTLKANFANLHLLGDYAPFKTNSFKIVGGISYLFNANGDLNFKPRGNYNFDGLELTSEEVGDLNIGLTWKGVAPYLGLGLLQSFPKNKFNVNIDFGTYYLTAPRSTVVGTKLLSDNDALEPQLDENMSSYRFLPVIQLNFNFKIK